VEVARIQFDAIWKSLLGVFDLGWCRINQQHQNQKEGEKNSRKRREPHPVVGVIENVCQPITDTAST
jgi:hypothetical protein